MKQSPYKPIRRRVLLPLSLTFAVLFCTFIYSNYRIRANQNLIDMRHRYEVTQAFNKESQVQWQTLMRNIMVEVTRDEQLRQAMAAADSATLYQLSLPRLKQLSETHGISHFYYHLPTGSTLLRVYNPLEVGGKVERNTFLQAARSREFSFGLELGKIGTLTYRGVLPWIVSGELIGYIELGIEFNYVLEQLKAIVKEDFLVTVEKSYVDREQWRRGREHFGRSQNWDILEDRVIAYQTLPDFNTSGEIQLLAGKHPSADAFSEIVIDQQSYRVKNFPLRDSADRLIGSLSVLHNITQEKSLFRSFISMNMLVSGGLCLALFFFTYTVLGRMDRRLAITRQRLNDKVANLKNVNAQLEEEISHRCKAESELHLLNETLEERVVQRTTALEEMNKEVQAKHATILHQDRMACIGQLAAGIAHDINNPVGFISHNLVILDRYLKRLKQFADLQNLLIKSRADAELITAWERSWKDFDIHGLFHELPIMLSECRDGTARISQTVQSLRNFSHKEIPQLKLTDLHQSIESSLSILCHQLRNKIEIVRDYGTIPRLDCYPGQMNQVFLNLLINATQAIADEGEIAVRTWADDRQIYVSISDNGCGIPADKLERIFEPFFTTKDVGVGTGLGLSIVYDIVTRHQGRIEVVSEVGNGTTFTLSLPFNVKPIPWDRQEEAGESEGLSQAETGHCDG
jgi:signal transduction histidine kinase